MNLQDIIDDDKVVTFSRDTYEALQTEEEKVQFMIQMQNEWRKKYPREYEERRKIGRQTINNDSKNIGDEKE